MARDHVADSDRTDSESTASVLSRRRVLAATAGVLAGSAVAGRAGAASHNAEVRENASGDFVAENLDTNTVVYEGGDYIVAMQSAVDSLTSGRTSKETVLVRASGDTGSHSWDGDTKGVDLPDYTTFECDSGVTINVTDSGDDLIIPIRSRGGAHIDIPNVNITGNPRYAMNLASVDDVWIGNADIRIPESSDVGIGIRVDQGEGSRSQNVTIDYAYLEATQSHGVETYGVDYFDVTTAVETVDTGGCGLLLNDTADATVERVDATRADQGGGYAGFRCANYAGPNITVNQVDAVDCGRGIFTVSGSSGIDVADVYLDGNGGNLIQDSQDVTIDGGTITNTSSSGVRLDSRSADDHPHTQNVTVKNLDVTDNGDYGVYETGPDTETNAIENNYFCNNPDGAIELYASSTTTSGNTFCDAGGSIADGTYYVTNVNSGKLLEVANAGTSDGDNVRQYADTGCSCQQWDVTSNGSGEYTFTNVNSGLVMEVESASTSDGANVQQYSDNGGDHQRWTLESASTGYKLVNVNSGQLADVEGASTSDGANVIQWPDNGGANQHWTFDPV